MRKEWIITLFLIVNKIFFNTFKLSKKTNNIVFLCDFGDNAEYVTKELGRRGYQDVVVLKTGKCKTSFKDAGVGEIVSFKPTKPFEYLRGLKRLATARTVLIDNYAAILSVCHFNDEVEVIQLWHAAGAVKKFGMADPSLTYRTPRAIKRIAKVYEEMDKIVVGSPFMAQIFARAFQKRAMRFYTQVFHVLISSLMRKQRTRQWIRCTTRIQSCAVRRSSCTHQLSVTMNYHSNKSHSISSKLHHSLAMTID